MEWARRKVRNAVGTWPRDWKVEGSGCEVDSIGVNTGGFVENLERCFEWMRQSEAGVAKRDRNKERRQENNGVESELRTLSRGRTRKVWLALTHSLTLQYSLSTHLVSIRP